MEKYVDIINEDIKRFIKNYLISGQLEDVCGMSYLEEYIPSKFPYLSILYLLKQSSLNSFVSDFISKFEYHLNQESNQLKELLGYFLCDRKELDKLQNELDLSQKEIEEKKTKIQLLNEDIEILKSKNQSQELKIHTLQDENNDLIHKISELELKLNEASQSPMKEYPREDKDKDGGDYAASAECSDLIDMGTSVLWRAYNLGSENILEVGDYYSWGALNNAEYFGKSVWGYKQVIKKSISGLSDCDAARSILGDGYRIPTVQEWKELLDICAYKPQKITFKGRNFVKLVSTKTNNTLLLPFIGHMEADICNNRLAQYWTSEQDTGKSSFICQFSNSGWDVIPASKWFGLPIRPIFDSANKDNGVNLNTESVEMAAQRVMESVRSSVFRRWSNSWKPVTSTVSTHKVKYPDKSKINQSNIFNIIIKDCIPYGKYVFEGDLVRDINLDLNKLNKILKENYSIQPLLFGSIASMRLKDLKALILSKLSR